MNESIKKRYRQLRNELDAKVAQLETLHGRHLTCKRGCDMCCLDFSILPLEYEVIKDETAEYIDLITPNPESIANGVCALLKDHSCSIYASRPFICRTHGLPLLYMDDEQWMLSHCELNFTEVEDDEYFSDSNCFEQDKWNSRLYMLNKEFLSSASNGKSVYPDLIPLAHLPKNRSVL